jgi:hypothetical protein
VACDGFCQTRSLFANVGRAKEGQGIGRKLALASNPALALARDT